MNISCSTFIALINLKIWYIITPTNNLMKEEFFMRLSKLIENLNIIKFVGNLNLEISDIVYDSRKVTKNSIFVCLKGHVLDGHEYIEDALKKGAVAIVSENDIKISTGTLIVVENTRKFLAEVSANFFGHPATKLKVIGLTGTKGKTTTSFMIKNILEQSGEKVGLIGTLGVVLSDKIIKTNNTTPESYDVQKHLKYMVDNGYSYCIIEASSIGLRDHRISGFIFDVGVFTNFSHDHIGDGEHDSIQEYLECKSILFKNCKLGIFNIDDNNFNFISKNSNCLVKTFGINSAGDYYASSTKLVNYRGSIGVKFDVLGDVCLNDVYIPIPGKFNIYNALAAIAVCNHFNVSSDNILNGLRTVYVKGRVEPVNVSDKFALFIDYAHNALSMENVLKTLREYNPKRLVTLFGAGGNRPKIRRYEMGEISGKYSDLSIITSDNPRFEEPLDIIEDIKIGINKTNGKYVVIPDRKEAIKYCIENAQDGDIIVLAGKGHEDYQEIKGIKYPMDERIIISEILKELKR